MARQLSHRAMERHAVIVAGFGFRAQADVASLIDAYHRALGNYHAEALATIHDKASHPVFQTVAHELGLPIIPVHQEAMTRIETPSQSVQSQAARGTGSVAEAAALSAAGTGAILLSKRVISDDRCATCALAQSLQEGSTS